jgi:hypothetical protein
MDRIKLERADSGQFVQVEGERRQVVSLEQVRAWHEAGEAVGYQVATTAEAPNTRPTQAVVQQITQTHVLINYLVDGRKRTEWVPKADFTKWYKVAA